MREMDITDILRGKSSKDCQCCAYGACECACDVTWPEQVAVKAADEIDRLRAENARQRAWIDGVMAQERHSLAAVPYAHSPVFVASENAPTMKTVDLITRPAPFEDK